ncbi:MAG: hypothetical protein DHS20C19_05020 [Acidimicrobiales bacterium]|nr:MAG: hypothetical protein DHS20C19_05020 [Acidimicrobiales bacterium]
MSTTYQDDRVSVDDEGIHIRSLLKTRHIPLADVRSARLFDLGMSRFRLIGIGPNRPRTWFPADPNRRHRKQGIELDVGRFFRVGITPDDPQAALGAIADCTNGVSP